MSQANGHEVDPAPVVLAAGHLVIYDDTAAGRGYAVAFKRDDTGETVNPPLPALVVPMLAKLLRGEDITADDIPGGLGMLGRLRGVLSRGE
jgi:hypothetical protein